MRRIAGLLRRAAWDLLGSASLRWRLVGVVLIGAAIPLSDLLVMKIFTDIVLSLDGTMPELSSLAVPIAAFAALFLVTRSAHYAQRMYRVTLFTRAFSSDVRSRGGGQESWRWALGLEMVNLLTGLTQCLAILLFITALAPLFGAVNLLVMIVLLQVLGRLFDDQLGAQRDYVAQGRARVAVSASVKVRSRISSAERGGLGSAGATLLQFAALLALALTGLIPAADTIVLYLGLRLQGSTVNTLSGSAMRFARAWAYTEQDHPAPTPTAVRLPAPSGDDTED